MSEKYWVAHYLTNCQKNSPVDYCKQVKHHRSRPKQQSTMGIPRRAKSNKNLGKKHIDAFLWHYRLWCQNNVLMVQNHCCTGSLWKKSMNTQIILHHKNANSHKSGKKKLLYAWNIASAVESWFDIQWFSLLPHKKINWATFCSFEEMVTYSKQCFGVTSIGLNKLLRKLGQTPVKPYWFHGEYIEKQN